MATSFKKKTSSKVTQPRGTRPSLHNAQALVSTGVPSLDALLGGGLPVGSVILVEEDAFGQYSRLLLKYFLAEGVMCGHSLLLGSASEDFSVILKDLPGAVEGEDDTPLPPTISEEEEHSSSEPMQIAWRYQSMPVVQSTFSTMFGHYYDLTKRMEPSRVEMVDKVFFDASEHPSSSSSDMLYRELKHSIEGAVSRGLFSLDKACTVEQANVLRVVIESMGSALWLEEEGGGSVGGSFPTALPMFLHSLRGVCRASYTVAMVTVPTHLFQDVAYIRRLERLCDAVVRLESFAGSEKEHSPLYKEYHGLFHLTKLPRLNSMTCHLPETLSLAFKLKRKKFTIEKLHLPPDLSGTANRAQQDGGCHQATHTNAHPHDTSVQSW